MGILALYPLPLDAALVLLPLIGVALNGTSSVLYGSVPDLVAPQWRSRALSIFYTGTIGSGAIAPMLFGRVGDAFGVWKALTLVAVIVLLTLPLAALLRGHLPRGYGSRDGVSASILRRRNTPCPGPRPLHARQCAPRRQPSTGTPDHEGVEVVARAIVRTAEWHLISA